MRFLWLIFVIAAGLLPSHALQHPPRKEKEALQPEPPKKYLRLFGKNVEPHKPVVAGPAGSSPSIRPVNELQCDPRTWQRSSFHHPVQALPSNHPWQGHYPSSIDHPCCEQIPSTLGYLHYGQGASSSLPPVQGSLAAIEQSSSSSSPQSSPDRAPGSSTFMRDARWATRPWPQYQQDEMVECQGKRDYAKAWENRKSKQKADYTAAGNKAKGDDLEMLEAEVHKWKFEGNDQADRKRAFMGASSGQYGTMRLGIVETTDQGRLRVPLPSPEWSRKWRYVFNREMFNQLRKEIKSRGWDLKQFDPSFAEKSCNVAQAAQSALNRWWTTTPEYTGVDRNKKLGSLFKVNQNIKRFFQKRFDDNMKLQSQKADQQEPPRWPDVGLIISDRFIPPNDTGATVYRSSSAATPGVTDAKATQEDSHAAEDVSEDEDDNS